jgi:hypothetical protein
MLAVDAFLPRASGTAILLHLVSIAVFLGALWTLGEITRKDFASLVPRQRAQ